MSTSCPNCGLRYNCVCPHIPQLQVDAHIALLMHENELDRDTNTGQWVLKSLTTSSQHVWQRKQACPELIALLQDPKWMPVLLFPSEESVSVASIQQSSQQNARKPLFIILDATWQEAKKILRKSPWLAQLPAVHVTPSQASRYQLRRNQDEGHLCTLEVAAEVIRELGDNQSAQQLNDFLNHYMTVFKADKSGHAYQPDR